MKYIKQKSNGKALYREVPHSDQAIVNASRRYGVDVSDLEVADENWSEEDWIDNIITYADKRRSEYPTIEELVVALYDTDDKAAIEKRRADVKAKYPKPE